MGGDQNVVDVTQWVKKLSREVQLFDTAFMKARDEGDWASCVAGYTGVLALLSMAFRNLPGFDASMLTVADLMLRLDELGAGNNSMPPPKRESGGRPPEGMRAAIIQGRAAAAVELLIRRGMKEREANEFIAKHLRKFGVIGRQGKLVSAGTVQDWRSKIADETAFCEKPDARGFYREALKTWEDFASSEMPLEQVKRFAAAFSAPSQSDEGRVLAKPHLSG